MRAECEICPHHCKIEEGHVGLCKGRMNKNGKIISENYGKLTAVALDPIEEEMKKLSAWLAGINPEIPLHISRFFPRWHMQDRDATPIRQVYHLAELARKNLKYVYEGNC